MELPRFMRWKTEEEIDEEEEKEKPSNINEYKFLYSKVIDYDFYSKQDDNVNAQELATEAFQEIKRIIEVNPSTLSIVVEFGKYGVGGYKEDENETHWFRYRCLLSHLQFIKVVPLCWVTCLGNVPLIELFLTKCPSMIHYERHDYPSNMTNYCYPVRPIYLTMNKRTKSLECMKLFLEHTPDLASMKDAKGRLPIHEAASNGFVEGTRLLLEMYPEGTKVTDDEGNLPINCAFSSCVTIRYDPAEKSKDSYLECLENVRLLLEIHPEGQFHKKKEDSFMKNGYLYLPIHQAVGCNMPDMVEVLVASNKKVVKMKDSTGKLPHHIAAEMGSVDCLSILIDFDREGLLTKDDLGNLPLHDALLYENVRSFTDISDRCVESILSACPESASMKNKSGKLPIHLAVWHPQCSVDLLKSLLDHYAEGASIKDDKRGLLPVQCLLMSNHGQEHNIEEMIQLLLSKSGYIGLFDGNVFKNTRKSSNPFDDDYEYK